jgi:hypothetical protein
MEFPSISNLFDLVLSDEGSCGFAIIHLPVSSATTFIADVQQLSAEHPVRCL